MAKGDDIQERMVVFSVELIDLCEALPKDLTGAHVGKQLIRSGTATASNYAEARAAESRNDFIHKLSIVLKELNETNVWLRILSRRKLGSVRIVEKLVRECTALSKIVAVSRRTAAKNARSMARG